MRLAMTRSRIARATALEWALIPKIFPPRLPGAEQHAALLRRVGAPRDRLIGDCRPQPTMAQPIGKARLHLVAPAGMRGRGAEIGLLLRILGEIEELRAE